MCTHERDTSRYITDTDWDGEDCSYWEYGSVSTCVDIDTHRYKCTQCNEVFYYSGAAKAYHEDGVKSEIKGLN